MPRIPKYRRHPNGQAFVQHCRKRYYLGKYGSAESHKRYQRFLARVTAAQPSPLSVAARSDATVVELIVLYREFAKRYYSKDGRPTKEYFSMDAALRPLDERFGDEIAAEFGPAKLLELQEYMMGLDWSRGVINHQISRVKRFFRWCSKKEYVPKELYAGLLCVDGLQKGRFDVREADEVRPVDLHWVYKTLPHMTPTVAAMVQAQLLCGMRPAEVCAMRGCHLNARGDVWIYSPPQHKNAWRDIVRNIPIPQVAQQVIKPFLKTDLEAFLFSPQESEAWRLSQRHPSRKTDRKTKVYPSELRAREKAKAARAQKPSRKRDHYDTDSYRRAITYAIDKANKAGEEIPHWHPHQLRHTISTEISQAIGEQAAQRWLGHEHLETTGIYTEKQIKELIEIAQELDRHWSRKQQAS